MAAIILSFLLSFSSANDGASATAARRALEARYRHAATLKASFFERYSDGKGGLQAESGTVYFSRPGRMRWDYEAPEEKMFLVDGANVWFYVPADRTASRAKLKESSDWRTPLALLTGKADLSHLCKTIELIKPEAGQDARTDGSSLNSVLRCTPRSGTEDAGGPLREVDFETDSEARLVRVEIREAGNAETEFRFADWEENLPLQESIFHFAPPPGVAIVDEAELAGSIH